MRGLSYTSILVAVLCVSVCTATDISRPVLKFGNNETDYVIFTPNMRPFRSLFSICSWVKRLETAENLRYWFSYTSISHFNTLASTDEDFVPGRWTHYCMVWSMKSRLRQIYFNGTLKRPSVSSIGMPETGGFLALGQVSLGDGTTYSYNGSPHPFGGELYKFNIFSKMLSAEEVRELYEAGICSNIEEKHGTYRKLRWEDIIKKNRDGNVQLVNLDVPCTSNDTLSFDGVQVKSGETESEWGTADFGRRIGLAELDIDWNKAFITATRGDLKRRIYALENELSGAQGVLSVTRNELKATETALLKTRSDLEETQTELERTKTDFHEKLDQTQDELNVTRADLNETRSELESTKLDLEGMIYRFYSKFQSTLIDIEMVEYRQDYNERRQEKKEKKLEAMKKQLELMQIRQDHTEKKQQKKEKELGAMRKQLKKTEKRLKKLLARNSGEG